MKISSNVSRKKASLNNLAAFQTKQLPSINQLNPCYPSRITSHPGSLVSHISLLMCTHTTHLALPYRQLSGIFIYSLCLNRLLPFSFIKCNRRPLLGSAQPINTILRLGKKRLTKLLYKYMTRLTPPIRSNTANGII